jgi:tRNA threonylcarbamoyladenosine biosynthesis protein TsaB
VTTLVVDTCLGACQVGLFEGARLLFGLSEPMQRGHQERLAPMAAEVMAGAGAGFAAVGKIAVTVGPGSFTGLRVGLAFAKGLSLGTGAPLAAIGTLQALAASVDEGGLSAGAIDARRGLVYLQAVVDGRPVCEPDILPASEAAARLETVAPGLWRVGGPGAGLLADADNTWTIELDAPSLLALGALAEAAAPAADVRPVYLRAPDARPLAERTSGP